MKLKLKQKNFSLPRPEVLWVEILQGLPFPNWICFNHFRVGSFAWRQKKNESELGQDGLKCTIPNLPPQTASKLRIEVIQFQGLHSSLGNRNFLTGMLLPR